MAKKGTPTWKRGPKDGGKSRGIGGSTSKSKGGKKK